MRSLVVDALERLGYCVRSVCDGASLLEQVSQQLVSPYDGDGRVDLLISDIRMPAVGGLAVVEALRKARCAMPVILMTAFGDEETRRQAESLGAILFDKPFALADLRRAVIELVPLSSGARES